MSDIHLEMGPWDREMPSGDVLILAGDISLVGVLDKSDDLHHRYPDLYARTVAFFTSAAKNFRRVFYLMGNHEAYHYNISKAPRVIRRELNGLVTLLDDHAVQLSDDVVLVGGTLWTDMNKGKAHEYIGGEGFRGARMNDFNLIWCRSVDKGTTRFTTHHAARRHTKTKQFISSAAKRYHDKTIVVATHHAPSYRGVNPFHGGSALDAGYASDMEAFIADRPNIRHWVFGHTHVQSEFGISQCRVHSNARGYVGRESSAQSFDPDRWFDVDTETHGRAVA